MGFDRVVAILELVFSFVGLVFVVFGWIIPYRQNLKMEIERKKEDIDFRRKQWEKDLLDAQVSEFYGPISALLQEQEVLFTRVMYMIGRQVVFGEKQEKITDLTEDEQKIWIHFINTYSIPLNHAIVEIIRSKQHLIYKSELPTCLDKFLDYALGWELLDNQKNSNVPNFYEYYYPTNFPMEFRHYINNTLKYLLERKKELTGEMGYQSTAY